MIGQNTAHIIAWLEADSSIFVSRQCCVSASPVFDSRSSPGKRVVCTLVTVHDAADHLYVLHDEHTPYWGHAPFPELCFWARLVTGQKKEQNPPKPSPWLAAINIFCLAYLAFIFYSQYEQIPLFLGSILLFQVLIWLSWFSWLSFRLAISECWPGDAPPGQILSVCCSLINWYMISLGENNLCGRWWGGDMFFRIEFTLILKQQLQYHHCHL